MTTVTQPYTYAISSIPGGFNGNSSSHLFYLIETQIPTGVNPVINSDEFDVVITFDADLTTQEKSTLDNLVLHSSDFFIITKDNGVTDLGNPAPISADAGLNSSTVVTLRYKAGDGTNFNGFGETVILRAPIMTIDKLSGVFDTNGLFQFTIGSELNRGTVEIEVDCDSLPIKTIISSWR